MPMPAPIASCDTVITWLTITCLSPTILWYVQGEQATQDCEYPQIILFDITSKRLLNQLIYTKYQESEANIN